MRLKFYRPIYWSIFLLCISFNVPANDRSSAQIIDSEIATSAVAEKNLNKKSILTLTKGLQNHSESESGSIGKTELRNDKHAAFDVPVQKNLQNHSQHEVESIGKNELRSNTHAAFDGTSLSKKDSGQYLALNSVRNEAEKNRSAFVESKHMQNKRIRGLESIAKSGLRNSEQIALMRPLSRKLRIDRETVESSVETEHNERPVFIQADLIQGHDELEIEGIGNAELVSEDLIITAERMKYYQDSDDFEVEGDVRIERPLDIAEGSRLKINLESKIGQMENPAFQLKDGSERGEAKTLIMKGDNQYRYEQARYTTCPEGNEDWIIEADKMELDDNDKTGTARNATLKFLGIPIGYTPWGSFSYSGERKTGFLAPLYSTNGRTGIDVSVPFYWNIAPNMDATVKARAMSKRGIMINNEFRYKTERMGGTFIFDVLPSDKVTEENRNRIELKHTHSLGKGWNFGFNYNKVSDDLFFRDLGKGLKVTSRTQLMQQAKLKYRDKLGKTGILQFSAQAQQFQTVQDPARPAGAPYKKLPQLLLRATQRDVLGIDLDLKASYTEFAHVDEKRDPNKVAGKRYTFFPNISKPIENSFGFITPKFGLHHTGYMLNRSTSNIPDKNISRTMPIMSLDSGLTATRETKIFGEGFSQTLEPRLFYVYIPHKDQSHIPNFDSGVQGFSFARVFSENKYSGNDRINDANRLTMSLSSRLIDENTGVERFRVAVAKQVHLTRPKVGVVANPKRNSDIVLAVRGKITPALSATHSMQIDHSKSRTDVMRSIISYQPEIGKVLNLGYRYTRGVLAQYDISGQWPITKRLRIVARKNYSLRDTRDLNELIGLEYNACCWTVRFVSQKLRTSNTRTNTTFFIQLELGGIMQIGSDPLKILTRGIQGYTNLDGRRNEDIEELR